MAAKLKNLLPTVTPETESSTERYQQYKKSVGEFLIRIMDVDQIIRIREYLAAIDVICEIYDDEPDPERKLALKKRILTRINFIKAELALVKGNVPIY